MTMLAPVRAARGDSVEAALHFLRPMEARPIAYEYDPPPGVPVRTGRYDCHHVVVQDARPLAPAPSLDVHGFALLHAPSAFRNFADEAAIRSIYAAETERIVAMATGAAVVLAFDHNVRSAARAARGEAGISGPVGRTHNDFTVRSGPDRARRELAGRGVDADALLRRRFAIVNLWRPIGRAVEKSPLALCDARTVAPDRLVPVDLIYRDRVGETYALLHDPAQRWYYFPHLAPDEAVLIKGYDSAEDGRARFAPHSAFADPVTPPDAPERESIEMRLLVVYPD